MLSRVVCLGLKGSSVKPADQLILISIHVRLQEKLLALKESLPQPHPTRCYEAHLWEDSDSMFQYMADWASKSTVPTTSSDAGRLFEDPKYLEQYGVHRVDSDVFGKAMTVEHDAYVSFENATYLRKVADKSLCVAVTICATLVNVTLET